MARFSHPAIPYELEYDPGTGRCKRFRGGIAEEAAPADLAVALLYEEVQGIKAKLSGGASIPVEDPGIQQRVLALESRLNALEDTLTQVTESIEEAAPATPTAISASKKGRKAHS